MTEWHDPVADKKPDTRFRVMFESNLPLIDRVVAFIQARQHLASGEAEDFASHVRLKLIENEYAILRQYSGRSSLETYLTVVIHRLLLDYRAHLWGKWRPSAEARRAGPIAVLLERLIVRDSHPFDEAREILRTNHGIHMSAAALSEIAANFPRRVRRRVLSDDCLEQVASPDSRAETTSAEFERQELATRVNRALTRALGGLPDQDRLILKLRFENGYTADEIAPVIGLTTRALYRRVEKLLAGIRRSMERDGLDGGVITQTLDGRTINVDWTASAAAIAAPGPSIKERG